MKLGTKLERPTGMEGAYPSSSDEKKEPEIVHKTISLPLKLLEGIKVKKGDRICIKLEGEIVGIHDDEYSSEFQMKAEEGQCLDNDEDGDEENGTYLGGEKEE